jgi:hypothetical protein
VYTHTHTYTYIHIYIYRTFFLEEKVPELLNIIDSSFGVVGGWVDPIKSNSIS